MIAELDKLTLENKNNNYFFFNRIFWECLEEKNIELNP